MADADRMEYRRAWGFRAGWRAYRNGQPQDANPFMPMPEMPMHACWQLGWREARNVRRLRDGEARVLGSIDRGTKAKAKARGTGGPQGSDPRPSLSGSDLGTVSDD